MSKKMILLIALFVAGLLMVLFRIEISRYLSDMTALFAAGCILAVIAGAGLLIELYQNRN